MKLLLLQPPIQDFYETDIRLQPIGLCYLKAAIKKFLPEVEVVIKDYHQGWGRRTIPLPKELSYLREFYPYPDKSPFSSFHHYYHFGAPFETIAEEVKKENPDLVGISSLFSPYYREVLKCADEIKKQLNVPILCGGSHVSACPEQILSHPSVDFIIRGEGEKPMVEFLKVFLEGKEFSNVPNLGYKKSSSLSSRTSEARSGIQEVNQTWIPGQARNDIVLNPLEENYELEELPAPDLSNLSPETYLYEKRPLSFVITSRSCPHRCSFCSVHQTFGLRFRRRSSNEVLSEIRARYQEGYRVFDFEDDNLTYYQAEMKKLCRALISEFPNRDVEFAAMNGISYLSLDRELLQLMKEAGFKHLNLALVTSDKTVRETTKRPHTTQKYLEVVHDASNLGFEIVSYQILGLPNESLESMIQTLIFNAELPVLLGASMFYLTPNSPIAKGFPERSETDIFKSRLTAMAIETEDIKREDIYTLFITTRILNFLKGVKISSDSSLEKVLMEAKKQDHRSRLGVEILERLFEEGILYAATSHGLKPLLKFKADLFFRVWNQLETIKTQNHKKISLNLVESA